MKTITKKLSMFVAAFALAVTALAAPLAVANPVSAQFDGGVQGGVNAAQGEDVPTTGIFGEDSIFTTVVNFMLFLIGALSVIMLIWGGIRYATSAGNSATVTSAKNTIMYAIIGLVIAFLAYAIVNWVLTLFVTA